jgi:hypothetical protein
MGRFEDLEEPILMNRAMREHYRPWAGRFHEAVRGRIGLIPGRIYHLWHGRLPNRRYHQRWLGFAGFDFDPAADLAVEPQGCWQWNSPKPAMHSYVEGYFRQRNEDSDD